MGTIIDDSPPEADQTGLFMTTFPVGPLQCNCTIIGDRTSGEALVVDPGGDGQLILDTLVDHGLSRVVRIIHTHAHFDHFLAAGHVQAETAKRCGCAVPIGLHKEDKPLWDNLEAQCARFSIPYTPPPPVDDWLADEEELTLPGCPTLKGVALHTPGHTPGSMSFYFEAQKLLVAGDTLFRGSIGRTDLWGGDYAAIERSIKQRLYTLDEATEVITGHGPLTTLGFEMRHNGFVTA